MKPAHLIAPVLALGGSAYWIHSQEAPLIEYSEKNRVIKERLAEAGRVNVAYQEKQTATVAKKPKDKFLLPDGTLDWKEIANIMAESKKKGGNQFDMRLMLKLQQKMMEMSTEEITDSIEKIRTLDISEKMKTELSSSLVMMLSEKDPEAALSIIGDDLDSENGTAQWQLLHSYQNWAQKDPTAALAWLDKKVADGKLESKSLDPAQGWRLQLEAKALGALFNDDPKTVRERLASFDQKERERILSDHDAWEIKGKISPDYLSLLRETYEGESSKTHIANAVGSQAYNKSLTEMTALMDEVTLSPEERQATIEKSLENFSRPWSQNAGKLDDIYPWLQKESPEKAAELTAGAILNRGMHNTQDFAGIFEQAATISDKENDPAIFSALVAKVMTERADYDVVVKDITDEALRKRFEQVYEELPKPEKSE